ncbi:tetratricopeptide repeat protein [Amycolatopsis sp. NPDC004169]|uniref:tetratricopeptide repeat protein n=1 Tax=Amycolatopsis sp. NPDC004169 TaxID=3154453 RepID=UPI0033A76307
MLDGDETDPWTFQVALTALREGRSEAAEVIRHAIRSGNPAALLASGYAQFIAGRTTGDDRLLDRAIATWTTAAEDGDPHAMHNLGLTYTELGRHEDAERWWHSSAQAGFGPAMTEMGVLHVKRGDVAEARRWWTEAAERGEADAMFQLAILAYQHHNLAAAETWCVRAGDARCTTTPTSPGSAATTPSPKTVTASGVVAALGQRLIVAPGGDSGQSRWHPGCPVPLRLPRLRRDRLPARGS